MDTNAIERLFRRVQMMLGRGRVTHVDDTGPVQIMQATMTGLETADNRLRVAEFGFTSNPPVGSDVLALHVAGDRGSAAVIATSHQESRPRGLQPGESILYSQDGKQVYMTASGGIVVEAKWQDVTVNNAATVTINAQNVVVNASSNVSVSAQGSVEISGSAGVSITTNGSANATINGSLSATAAGPVSISAPSISLN